MPDRETALALLALRYAREAPFSEDRARVAELAREAAPVVDALIEGVAAGALGQADAGLHEALAMATLLGRRAADLGVTPTALLALSSGVEDALASLGVATPSLVATLRGLLVEGYARGREEGLVADAGVRAAQAIPLLALAPGCYALVIAGTHDPEPVHDVVDALGRALLATGAHACIVDVERLVSPTVELAAEIFSADITARMLGLPCWFTGVAPELRALAARARVPVDVLRYEPHFADALPHALLAAGQVMKPEGPLASLLRRK